MKKFGWDRWFSIQKSNRWRSLERWALYHLHHPHCLDDLAESVVFNNIKNGISSSVCVESVWIDGTPQAKAFSGNGTVKCELADLLYIVEEYDSNGVIFNEKGLLIQAKVTAKYNKLNSNSSTKKERKLFESIDTSKPLDIYCGTNIKSQKIGSYLLGGANNLFDCSRFLLMPKKNKWQYFFPYLTPFHICWPKSKKTPYMGNSLGLVNALQLMTKSGVIGKNIGDPQFCDWSKLVRDLQNKYKSVQMNGYNKQYRIYRSEIMHCIHDKFDISPAKDTPKYFNLNSDITDIPNISIITLRIKYQNSERVD